MRWDLSPGWAMPDRDWTKHLRAQLACLSLDPARELEIIEELSQDLDQRYEDFRAGGATDAEAQRMALAELLDEGALSTHMRSLRQAHVPPSITPGGPKRFLANDLWEDIRYTTRALRQHRAFAAVAILTLALGIGATTAIFSVVNSVLIKPLPYPDSDRLVRIVHTIGHQTNLFFRCDLPDVRGQQPCVRRYRRVESGSNGDDHRPGRP
jgi:hypothetical protein